MRAFSEDPLSSAGVASATSPVTTGGARASKSLGYRPEIDGLRSLAILPVIWFHLNRLSLPGGYLGVDLFFVISGFLITSIIVADLEGGRFTFAGFFGRRIRRILPAASFVLVATSIANAILLYHPDIWGFSAQKIASLLSYANFHFLFDVGSYWGPAADQSPYLHYWSLSVEEQYYLVYPLLLVLVFRSSPRMLLGAAILITAGSFALFAWGHKYLPSATFYLLPSRAWELGAGCLLAIGRARLPSPLDRLGTLMGMALILSAFAFANNKEGVGLEMCVAVCGAALVIASGSNPVSRPILENKAVVFVGRISFSLYLWHWPVIVVLKSLEDYHRHSVNLMWAIPITLVASILSYYAVERPFRFMKSATPWILCWSVLAGTFFLAERKLFLNGDYAKGRFERSTWHGTYYDCRPELTLPQRFKDVTEGVDVPLRGNLPVEPFRGGIIRKRDSATPRVVVIGDSHAAMWCKLIDDITGDLNVTTSLWAMQGVPPFYGFSQVSQGHTEGLILQYMKGRLDCIKSWKPDLVIVIARWDVYPPEDPIDLFRFLNENAKRVLLLEQPPVLVGVDGRNAVNYISFLKLKPRPGAKYLWKRQDLNAIAKRRDTLGGYVNAYDRFAFLPLADLWSTEAGAVVAEGRTVYYLDDDHLTDAGSLLARQRLELAIRHALDGEMDAFPLVGRNRSAAAKTLEMVKLPIK